MNPENLERFFVAYLEENKLDFKVSGRVYTVKFDKDHKKWYNQEKLKCTFDPKVAKEKDVTLLGVGTYLFDSMAARYADQVTVSNLKLPRNEDDVLEVNEKLGDLNKQSPLKMIDELSRFGGYVLFEVAVQTAQKKERYQVPLLVMTDMIVPAFGFEESDFELVEEDTHIGDDIERALDFVPTVIGEELAEAEKQHYSDMKNLKGIQMDHNEDLYSELQKKENVLLHKIQDQREKEISGKTFAIKANATKKIKELKRKYDELVEKHKKKREEIKAKFEKEVGDLKHKELHVEAKVLAYSKVDFPLYNVKFEDDEEFFYIPCLKKFFKKEIQEVAAKS